MSSLTNPGRRTVFISYSSRDRDKVLEVGEALRCADIDCWRDGEQILGGDNYGPRIVQAIRDSAVLLLMCSDASLRSKNVKQEIQLAWKYDVQYLPVLLETVSFPEQIQYWLEGTQWIEVLDRPESEWLPRLLESLQRQLQQPVNLRPDPKLSAERSAWEQLWRLARFTDQVWPVPADSQSPIARPAATRGLGAAQPSVQHGYRLGSRVRLVMELEHEGHVLLLDRGPEGILYCLCPSLFAPQSLLTKGRWIFPQPDSPLDAFVVTGRPGREELMAIVTRSPLPFDWMPTRRQQDPAKALGPVEIEELLAALRSLPPDCWRVNSSYFDVVA